MKSLVCSTVGGFTATGTVAESPASRGVVAAASFACDSNGGGPLATRFTAPPPLLLLDAGARFVDDIGGAGGADAGNQRVSMPRWLRPPMVVDVVDRADRAERRAPRRAPRRAAHTPRARNGRRRV